jgi:DNA-binding transcriptional regulator YiaG
MTALKEAREAAGLTQQAMSDMFGIPLRTIGGWDRGLSSPPAWVERLVLKELASIKAEKEDQKDA